MVAQTGLIDLGCLRGKFTWFQKTLGTVGGTSVKRARLDRDLASIDWRLLFPNAIVEAITASTSDYKPILLNTDGGARCTRAQFKYELMWGQDSRCLWVVRNAWRDKLHQNPMQVLEAKSAVEKIEANDQVQAATLGEARALLNEALRREEIFWKQNLELHVEDGTWVSSLDSIAELFIEKFNSTFSRPEAPGPDGLSTGFYLQHLNVVRRDFFDMITILGLAKRLTTINRQFMMKWAWKALTDKSSIWSSMINAKYIEDRNFLLLDRNGGDLGMWKAILDAWSVLQKGLCRRIRNGLSTSIWFDPWVPSLNRTPIPLKDVSHGVAWVNQFLLPDKSWNVSMVREWFEHEDAKAILNIELPDEENDDSWLWLGGKNGSFSIKSASRIIKGDYVENGYFRLQVVKSRFQKSCSNLNEWGINHISRKCNYLAHNIAKWAAFKNVEGSLKPSELDGSVMEDLVEWDPGPRLLVLAQWFNWLICFCV
uniref:RNase H type-1 domain-containing protein n=1 Tax=Cannabis sativa TaxID=3483 RepID=A0A803Q1I4_CANSA